MIIASRFFFFILFGFDVFSFTFKSINNPTIFPLEFHDISGKRLLVDVKLSTFEPRDQASLELVVDKEYTCHSRPGARPSSCAKTRHLEPEQHFPMGTYQGKKRGWHDGKTEEPSVCRNAYKRMRYNKRDRIERGVQIRALDEGRDGEWKRGRPPRAWLAVAPDDWAPRVLRLRHERQMRPGNGVRAAGDGILSSSNPQ